MEVDGKETAFDYAVSLLMWFSMVKEPQQNWYTVELDPLCGSLENFLYSWHGSLYEFQKVGRLSNSLKLFIIFLK